MSSTTERYADVLLGHSVRNGQRFWLYRPGVSRLTRDEHVAFAHRLWLMSGGDPREWERAGFDAQWAWARSHTTRHPKMWVRQSEGTYMFWHSSGGAANLDPAHFQRERHQ